jgi:hypothetical protein
LSAAGGETEQYVCMKFCMKPLKCFVRLLENILLAKHQFLCSIRVSGLAECQLKMMNVQDDQAPAK